MIKKGLTLLTWVVSGMLLLFTLRRWLFVFVAILPAKSKKQPTLTIPDVLLLVPIRNEAEALITLLPALADLQYAKNQLTIVLIDDGSTDTSRAILQKWVDQDRTRAGHQWQLLLLDQNVGKAQALNIALQRFEFGEIIAVYDADERPQADALSQLTQPFAGQSVGGVSGRRAVSNALTSPAATYTAIEGLVHQLITMQAKDRLNLAPALLGANCAYRRSALAAAGGFKPGALLEDSDITIKLRRSGWKIRFVPAAISYHQVPQTIAGYWRQHTRWARGFNDVAKDQAIRLLSDQRLSWGVRLELLLFSLGYLDRIALLSAVLLAIVNRARRRWLVGTILLNLITPFLQIIAALKLSTQPRAMWLRLVWVPFFFVVDIAMAATGFWTTLANMPQNWEERRMRL